MSDPMMAISIMIQSTYLGTAGYTFLHTPSMTLLLRPCSAWSYSMLAVLARMESYSKTDEDVNLV